MRVTLLLLLALLLVSGGVLSADEGYRLGPEDVVSVTVLRHPELGADLVTVTSDGLLQVPVAGAVAVGGKTAQEASAAIAQALRGRLLSPEVTLSVKQLRTNRIFVLGGVTKPGIYDLKPGWRVTEALAAAGGLLTRPELLSASVFRLSKETLTLDLPGLLGDGSQASNVVLQPGDVLSLTERTLRVSVAGQVLKPGACDVPIGSGAVQAVAMAGGAAPKAALSKVTVQHADGTVVPVDLFRAMTLGRPEADVKLAAGDLVLVPEAKAKVAVLGAVRNPGYYDLEEGVTPRVADAVALAGGAVKGARLTEVGLMRTEGGQSVRRIVNLERVLRAGKTAEDVPVQSGDLIFVPDKKIDWDFALRAITSLSLLGNAF